MKYCVDRTQDGLAVMVAESGERITVPADSLPEGVRDGSIVVLLSDGTFDRDIEAENERRKMLFSKLQKLKDRNK